MPRLSVLDMLSIAIIPVSDFWMGDVQAYTVSHAVYLEFHSIENLLEKNVI